MAFGKGYMEFLWGSYPFLVVVYKPTSKFNLLVGFCPSQTSTEEFVMGPCQFLPIFGYWSNQNWCCGWERVLNLLNWAGVFKDDF